MSNRLYIKPVGGLANRLRVINSAVILAKSVGSTCVVLWERNPDLNASFHSLFNSTQDFEVVELAPGFQWKGLKPTYFPDKQSGGIRNVLFSATKGAYGFKHSIWYQEFENIFSELKGQYRPDQISDLQDLNVKALPRISELLDHPNTGSSYISTSWEFGDKEEFILNLEPSDSVSQLANEINIGSTWVGVHIRRTDNTWSSEHSGMDKFRIAMKNQVAANSQIEFLVATDDPNCVDELRQEFGDKIHFANPPALDRNDPIAIKYALVDMVRLSRCQLILGSYFSSFSDIASKMGRTQLEIIT